MKKCSKCGEEKDLSFFQKRADCRDGTVGVCRKCRNAWHRRNVKKRKSEDADFALQVKIKRKEYYKKNKYNESKKQIAWNSLHKEENKRKRAESKMKDHSKWIYYVVKYRAKQKGIAFDLTKEDIKWNEFCPIFGIKLEHQKGKYGDNSPSIDRIDNKKGYVKGNIVIVSMKANRLKSDASIDDLKKIYDFYKTLTENMK